LFDFNKKEVSEFGLKCERRDPNNLAIWSPYDKRRRGSGVLFVGYSMTFPQSDMKSAFEGYLKN